MNINEVSCKSALSKSLLPGLDYAINPYRGCQHGCIYCYSPGVLREKREWGSFIDVKRNLPLVLGKELKKKKKGVVGLGTVTDAYQPIEKEFQITRRSLEQLLKYNFPVSIQTKSDLVLRDLDLIKRFSVRDVGVSISTLDSEQAKLFEPVASPPDKRLSAISRIASEGIDAWVFIGPILPFVTDMNLEALVEGIANSGVRKVIIDKLRLRGNFWDRIEKNLKGQDQTFLNDFKNAVKEQYYLEVEKRLVKLCNAHGIRHESAFKSWRP